MCPHTTVSLQSRALCMFINSYTCTWHALAGSQLLFHFRAGEERCPSMGAAATSANSETAATRVHDGLVGCDGTGYHGESLPPPASDPDGLRRRAAKERIRERILREEVEAMALEFEVRRELMEERASLLARLAGGSETRAAPAVPSLKTAPIDHQCVQFGSKVDVSAAVPANKRKTPHVAAASVSVATGSKKHKPDLTCTVCNITATSEVALQEHLRGKSHVRKAGKHAQPHPEEDVFSLKVNGSPALPAKGENPGVVVASMAPAEKSCDNLGLNCIVCGITASSQKNMQDHLKGKIHMRKTDMLAQPNPKENEVCSKPNASAAVLPAKQKNSDVAPASSTLSAGPSSKNQKQDLTCTATSKKGVQAHLKGHAGAEAGDGAAKAEEQEKADVEEEGAVEIDGGPVVTGEEYYIKAEGKLFVTLRQVDDSLSCGLCAVHGCDKRGMINHIYTRDHWRRASLTEEKGASEAALEAVSKDGDGVPVTDGEAHVDN
ncbi:uncharacterized protein LOC125533052 [Triticum urartu]|uniref:uncharacterized protein LOC125533052 n=1 Tax=Triticum urartu TaxID=4572 RepID=UPI0020449821|nr:uncharacterized protein LOC125533052 [Triticum urartu]